MANLDMIFKNLALYIVFIKCSDSVLQMYHYKPFRKFFFSKLEDIP